MDIRHKIERQAYTLYLKADNDLPNGLVSGRHNCFGDGNRPETAGNQTYKYNEVNPDYTRLYASIYPLVFVDTFSMQAQAQAPEGPARAEKVSTKTNGDIEVYNRALKYIIR